MLLIVEQCRLSTTRRFCNSTKIVSVANYICLISGNFEYVCLQSYNMIIFLAGNTARITPCHKVTISCYLCVVFMYQYLDTMVYDYRFVDTVNTIKDITVLTSKALIHNCDNSKIRFQMLKMRSTLLKYVMISMYL